MNTKKRAIALILYVALCFSIVAGVIGNPADNKSKIDAQIGEILNTLSSEFVKCDCGTEGGLEKHDASCARVKECLALAANNTASELYSKWDNFPEDACEYILAYLSQNAPDKYLVLKYALDNTETKYEKFDSDLTIEEDTVAVEVMAPEGAFNDGTAMSVEVKDVEKISKADKDASKDVVNAIGEDVTALDVVKSVDITFAQKNNPEMTNLQPKDDVLLSVSLKRSDFSANAVNAALVHIADDGSREVVGYVGLPADNDATVELKAWVGGFSEYVVVESRGDYQGKLLSTEMKNDPEGYVGKSISTFPVTLFNYHGGEMNKYFWEKLTSEEVSKSEYSYMDHVAEYFAFISGTAYYSAGQFNQWGSGAKAFGDNVTQYFNTAYFKDVSKVATHKELTQYQSYLKRNALTLGLGGKLNHELKPYKSDDPNSVSPNPAFGNINGIGINYSQPTDEGTAFAKQGIVKTTLGYNGINYLPVLSDANDSGWSLDSTNLEMQALFDPDFLIMTGSVNNTAAKEVYDADFEFIYDQATKTYSYESKNNHAQYNYDKNKVELYKETLSAASGMTRIDMTKRRTNLFIDDMPTFEVIDNTNDAPKIWLSNCDGTRIPPRGDTNTRPNDKSGSGITKIDYDVYGDGSQFIRYYVHANLKSGVTLNIKEFNGSNNIDLSNSYIYIKYRACEITNTYNGKLSDYVGVSVSVDGMKALGGKTFYSETKTGDWVSALFDTSSLNLANSSSLLKFDFSYDDNYENELNQCCIDIAEVAYMKMDTSTKERPAAHGQFFPFENIANSYQNVQTNATAAIADGEEKATLADRTLAVSGNSMPDEAAHFGMTMELKFYLPENRMNDDKPITFEFSGDDDMWVYVDNELALDIGGCHGQVTGKIEFLNNNATGEDWDQFNGGTGSGIKSTVSAAYNLNGSNTKTPKFKEGTILASETEIVKDENTVSYSHNGLEAGTYHTLRIYYLERGSFESNCNIKFNLPVIPDGDVYIHNDVEYKIAKEDGNTSNEENSLVINGGEGDRRFKNDEFLGKLYDFKVVYTTSDAAIVNWQTDGLVKAYEYSLFETANPINTIEGLYASADGVLSIPAGWTAVVSVPRQVQATSEVATKIYAMELGVHNGTDKAGGILTPQSDKAFTNLPGNYKYGMDNRYSEAYTYIDALKEAPTLTGQDLKSKLLALESAYGGEGSGVVHFQFINYYTWQIDFGTQYDTDISSGDKSTTLDIDEDVKVTFENKLGEENWLDGEGSVDNDFGTGKSTSYPIAEQEN